jgi:hypothetical protein
VRQTDAHIANSIVDLLNTVYSSGYTAAMLSSLVTDALWLNLLLHDASTNNQIQSQYAAYSEWVTAVNFYAAAHGPTNNADGASLVKLLTAFQRRSCSGIWVPPSTPSSSIDKCTPPVLATQGTQTLTCGTATYPSASIYQPLSRQDQCEWYGVRQWSASLQKCSSTITLNMWPLTVDYCSTCDSALTPSLTCVLPNRHSGVVVPLSTFMAVNANYMTPLNPTFFNVATQ